MAIYLISTNLLRESGLFDTNIQESDLKVALSLAQDNMLKKLLGNELFDKLINLIEEGTITEPENEPYLKFIRGVLRNVLIYYTYYKLLSIHNITITNTGVNIADREGVKPAPLSDIISLKSIIKDEFRSYENDLKYYLNINKDDFPEYFEPSEDSIKPIQTNRVKGVQNINKIMSERYNR